MVHLNRHKLSGTQQKALFSQLNQTLTKLSKEEPFGFLSELLGKEEQIMIAKRLAIVVLLIEEKSLYSISRTVKVSPSTAGNIKRRLDSGHYTQLVAALCRNKKDYFAILDTLDNILHLGGILPHYNGLDRYRI